MKVVLIGSDRKLFEQGSAVQKRTLLYGSRVESLSIIVLSLRSHNLPIEPTIIAPNITLYATNSLSRIQYILDAYKAGSKLLKKLITDSAAKNESALLISAQDPFESGLVAYVLSRLYKIRLHIQIHTDFLSNEFARESILNRVRVFMSKIILPYAHGIRTVSERINSSIRVARIVTMSQPVVLPIYVPREEIEKKLLEPVQGPKFSKSITNYVLMVSRLEREKNIAIGIEAFAKMLERLPKDRTQGLGLVIVGDGRYRGQLEVLVEEKKLSSRVEFVGWQNDLSSYYRCASVFLQTSLYEGYGLTLAEAALYSCPIVTTDVGIAGHILAQKISAIIAPVNDIEKLSAGLEYCCLYPEEARNMTVSANNQIRKSLLPTEDVYIDAYIELWEKCLQ